MEEYGQGIYGGNGRVEAIEGLVYDVTERKEAEEALRRSEERFRSLVQNASEVILLVGNEGTVRYASPGLERVLGYKPKDVLGNDALEAVATPTTWRPCGPPSTTPSKTRASPST